MLARERLPARLVAIGDRELLRGFPHIEHVPLMHARVPGKLDPANSRYVLAVLERALPTGRAFSSVATVDGLHAVLVTRDDGLLHAAAARAFMERA